MKKVEKITMASLIVAMGGIIVFWSAGFCENYRLAAGGLLTAGVSSWVWLITLAVKRVRYRHLY